MRRDDWLLHQLPVAMTEDDFLVRFVTIFQEIGESILQQVDDMPHQFDPTVAAVPMVRAMGAWLGVDWIDPSLEDARQREIVLRYSELVRWRGTARGLRQLLEILTDGDVVIRDSGGVYPAGEAPAAAPHVRIEVGRPKLAETDDLVRIVRDELPAMATFELHTSDGQAWPKPKSPAVFAGVTEEPSDA